MTEDRLPLTELLQKSGEGDFLRSVAGISKSQVSKLCKEIDERVRAFLDRPLEGEWPYPHRELCASSSCLRVSDAGLLPGVRQPGLQDRRQ